MKQQDVTDLLIEWRRGDVGSLERGTLIYDELRTVARAQLRP